jgi:hypothetical protein
MGQHVDTIASIAEKINIALRMARSSQGGNSEAVAFRPHEEAAKARDISTYGELKAINSSCR